MSGNDFKAVVEIMVMAIIISVILLLLGVGFLILMHVCIVGRAIRARFTSNTTGQRQEPAAGEETGGRGGSATARMSKDDVENLPCYDYNSAGNGNNTAADCAVCLENFKNGEKCRLLPVCSHSFHARCVDSWLVKTPICPICRTGAGSRKDGGEKSENVVIQEHLVGVQPSSNSVLTVDHALQPSIV